MGVMRGAICDLPTFWVLMKRRVSRTAAQERSATTTDNPVFDDGATRVIVPSHPPSILASGMVTASSWSENGGDSVQLEVGWCSVGWLVSGVLGLDVFSSCHFPFPPPCLLF